MEETLRKPHYFKHINMIRQVQAAKEFVEIVTNLRKNSPLFPDITISVQYDNLYPMLIQLFASTKVRLNIGGVWYIKHVVETLLAPNNQDSYREIGNNLTKNTRELIEYYNIHKSVAIPDGFLTLQDIDTNQKD